MTLLFEPIELSRQKGYLRKYEQSNVPASDYTFVNLWGWAQEYYLEWAWTDNLIWIRQIEPEIRYWAPIGNWQTVDWTATLKLLPEKHISFIRVPESLCEIWQKQLPDMIKIKETRGQWDYLYDVEELTQLKGNRFHKKKNLVNQFKRRYDYIYRPFDEGMIDRALALQADWCTWKDCEANEILTMENRVIEKILTHGSNFEQLIGGALFVEDELVSYTIAEVVFNRYLVIHFEKGNPAVKGSYQAINQMFLEHSGQGYLRVNREQDIDDPGLRKAKLSYNPVDFIKKNSVYIG
jgi:hypothetical protein